MLPITIGKTKAITLSIKFGKDIKATLDIKFINENTHTNSNIQEQINKELEEYINQEIKNQTPYRNPYDNYTTSYPNQFLYNKQHSKLDFYYQTAVKFLNTKCKITTEEYVIKYLIRFADITPHQSTRYDLNIDFEKASFIEFSYCNLEIFSDMYDYNRDLILMKNYNGPVLTINLDISSKNQRLKTLHIRKCILTAYRNNLNPKPEQIILDQVFHKNLGNINFDLRELQTKSLILKNYKITELEKEHINTLEERAYNIVFEKCVINTKIYKREKKTVDSLFRSLVFQECTFKYDCNLEKLKFDKLELIDCMFEGIIKFDRCLIALLNIQNCTFNNKFTMQFCQISILAFIYDSLFKSMVSFHSSYFLGSLYLKANVFQYGIDLTSTSYGHTIKISTSSYNGSIVLNYNKLLEKRDKDREYYQNFELLELSEYKTFLKNVISNCFMKDDKRHENYSSITITNQHSLSSYTMTDLTDFRISCSIFKDTLDKGGNKIDANIFYSLEHLLYGYELKTQKVLTWQGFLKETAKYNLAEITGILERKILLKPRLWGSFILQIIKNSKHIINFKVIFIFKKVNLKLLFDKFLFCLNNLVSNHNSNLFRAVICFIFSCIIGAVITSCVDSFGSWKDLFHFKYWVKGKFSFNFDYLFKIIFPFEGIPNEHIHLKGGFMGKNKIAVNFSLAFFKIISIYIIWQIIKTANRNFKR